ncbi:unnamed protein product [Gadus morhua 'NCC']
MFIHLMQSSRVGNIPLITVSVTTSTCITFTFITITIIITTQEEAGLWRLLITVGRSGGLKIDAALDAVKCQRPGAGRAQGGEAAAWAGLTRRAARTTRLRLI